MHHQKLLLADLTRFWFTVERRVLEGFKVISCRSVHLPTADNPSAHRIAQVHAVFSISPAAQRLLFPMNNQPPEHLAYIEWFTPFWPQPEVNSRLYKVSHAHHRDARIASIIPIGNITQSIHLFPLVGSTVPRDWNSATVIEHCQSFLVNSFMNVQTYVMFNE